MAHVIEVILLADEVRGTPVVALPIPGAVVDVGVEVSLISVLRAGHVDTLDVGHAGLGGGHGPLGGRSDGGPFRGRLHRGVSSLSSGKVEERQCQKEAGILHFAMNFKINLGIRDDSEIMYESLLRTSHLMSS